MQGLPPEARAALNVMSQMQQRPPEDVLRDEIKNYIEGRLPRIDIEGAIKALWDVMVPFADYAFNKSHAAGYAYVSYWTAYLKANYPAEYMAALLESVHDDKDKMAVYLGECRRMGIKVLPPDVNESEEMFTPVGSDIRYGLGAIRNVGDNVVLVVTNASGSVNGKNFVTPAAAGDMSAAERSYFVVGNLAAAYHNGHNKEAAYVDGKTVMLGAQPIMTCTYDDESAQKLADRLNKIK